jgi:lysozyme
MSTQLPPIPTNQPSKPSEQLIQNLKAREGYTSVCQRLKGDRPNVFTYGYGCTGCKPGEYISETDADQLLREKVQGFATGVNRLVKVALTQDQYDALTDFSYNLGLGTLQRSTLLKLLNQGDYEGADDEFDKFDLAGGVVLSGLLSRREDEAKQFAKTIWMYKSC